MTICICSVPPAGIPHSFTRHNTTNTALHVVSVCKRALSTRTCRAFSATLFVARIRGRPYKPSTTKTTSSPSPSATDATNPGCDNTNNPYHAPSSKTRRKHARKIQNLKKRNYIIDVYMSTCLLLALQNNPHVHGRRFRPHSLTRPRNGPRKSCSTVPSLSWPWQGFCSPF